MLEKNTNSGLNTFQLRDQQVVLGNVYMQDFFFPGYTAEFVGAWNKDDRGVHYDDNGFLVRPAPIGNVINQGMGPIPHGIRVGYFGWLGSGHIKRVNLTHAFYQAVGEDTFNPIAGTARHGQRANGGGGTVAGSRLDSLSSVDILQFGRCESTGWPRTRIRFDRGFAELCGRNIQLLESGSVATDRLGSGADARKEACCRACGPAKKRVRQIS